MDVLRIVKEHLPEGKKVRVKKIFLKVGKLTAVVPETFRFCMEVICKDTEAEGAEVKIEEVPLRVQCQECGKIVELQEALFLCPDCESGKLAMLSGRELYVDSIEVEEE